MHDKGNINRSASPVSGISPRSVRRVAMDCLARREHSFFELKKKLQLKFPDKSIVEIQQELEKLRDENLQSDKRFVESYVRYRKSRGFGYLHIRNELRSKYVADVLIDQLLFVDDSDWLEIINNLVAKRARQSQQLTSGSKDYFKIIRYLEQRGFPLNLTEKVLAKHLSH